MTKEIADAVSYCTLLCGVALLMAAGFPCLAVPAVWGTGRTMGVW